MLDSPRIAVVEDETQMREILLRILRDAGMDAKGAHDGASGIDLVLSWAPDLVLLNLGLPGFTWGGFEVCRHLRQHRATGHIPVIIYTGSVRDSLEEEAIEAGAEDLLRSCNMKAAPWLRRIRAVLERGEHIHAEPIHTTHVSLHPRQREAHVGGRILTFPPTEFDILYRLARNPGRALSRAELLSRGVDPDPDLDLWVDRHVLSARRKLGKDAWVISTVWGVGYRLGEAPSGQEPPA